MTNATLLAPVLLAAGFFSTQADAHDVVLTAAVPGFSFVLGAPPPPPQVVYVEQAAPVVYYEEYQPYYPQPVRYRPRVIVDHHCDHRGAHEGHEFRAARAVSEVRHQGHGHNNYRQASHDNRHGNKHRGRH